jgi:predicted DNA-binding transcriptional regulator AlpA
MSSTTSQPERLLHSAEAARLLGVSPAWMARERWKGSGPSYVRVGGPQGRAVRYRTADISDWIDRNSVRPLSK